MVASKQGITLGMLRAKTPEIQSDRLAEIARRSVLEAFRRWKLPVIVEDAGLFVDELKGFPGPYSAYVYKTIGNQGLIKLLENVENRRATFRSLIAYYADKLKAPMCFEGKVVGNIIREEKRKTSRCGFGFDPIFQPLETKKTFAELSIEEKNKFSHRGKALNQFAEWYKKLQ